MPYILKIPTPDQVKNARALAGQTQEDAAKTVHMANYKVWQNYELGKRVMSLPLWELYLIKTFTLFDKDDYEDEIKKILKKLK